jgi:homoserine O-acetyltransferase
MTKLLLTMIGLAVVALSRGDGDQQFCAIGDLKLQSGSTINDCKIGYRTFGKLGPKGDNAVLVPTWYLGTSADLRGSFRPGGLVDSSKYFVIAVDALGNGVSTSPSNSQTQRDAAFPTITIRDMVESQHKMLLRLGITHLHAVMGISMGGFQTFQWITAFPNFVDKAIPILGSPRPTSYDLMFYASSLKTVNEAINNKSARASLIRSFADFFWLALNTPAYYVEHTRREGAVESLRGFEAALLAWDPYDMASGLNALLNQDVFKPFGDSEASAAKAVRAQVLVVAASQDHCVNPTAALSFAKALRAHTLVLTGDAGHSSPGAEMKRLGPTLSKFLSQP